MVASKCACATTSKASVASRYPFNQCSHNAEIDVLNKRLVLALFAVLVLMPVYEQIRSEEGRPET